jgi:hypothetical protein
MRVFTVVVAALVLAATVGAAVRAAALPTDVRGGLAEDSIEVGPPTGAPARLPVSAARAKGIVKRHFSPFHGHRISVYLVRITGHPGLFDPLPQGRGWTSITPLQVGDLAWIVVIRGVPIPINGPPGGTVRETLVVIVETTHPKWVVGLTIGPGGLPLISRHRVEI